MTTLTAQQKDHIKRILEQWKRKLGRRRRKRDGKALETYITLAVANRLARAKGLHGKTVRILDAAGQVVTKYVPRGSPGHLSASSKPGKAGLPTHVRVEGTVGIGGPPLVLEIHQSVRWKCCVGSFHELDVCVASPFVPAPVSDQFGQSHRITGVECKDWRRAVPIGVGRDAAMVKGLLDTQYHAIVSTAGENPSLTTFLTALATGGGQAVDYYPGVSVAIPSNAELVADRLAGETKQLVGL